MLNPFRSAPMPRLMLYTSPTQYAKVVKETVCRDFASDMDDLRNLEQAIEAKVGVRHAICMPMARVAIYATLRALIKPGQKVICSPYTIADVINMIVCSGGIPVFADIERETCNIDPANIEALIGPDTGAVLITHFYGLVCDVERIAAICRARGVPMIEDAAQAFGASVGGRAAGTFGTAGIYSFGMYKNVNAFFGGAVVTSDDGLAAKVRSAIRTWPYQPLKGYLRKVMSAVATDAVTHPLIFRSFTFWLFRWAFLHDIDAINNKLKIDVRPVLKNEMPAEYMIRMLPLQARLIYSQLEGVSDAMYARIGAAAHWHKGLCDLPDLVLPPLRLDGSHSYWYFPVQFDKRHDLVAYAQRHYRDITESYHRNCAGLSCFANFARNCPNAERTANSLIYLPTYPRYAPAEIDKTIGVIRAYFGR